MCNTDTAELPTSILPGMDAPDGFAKDTDTRTRGLLVAKWRTMTLAERVTAIEALHRDCSALAIAGIRTTDPEATPDRVRYLLATRRYGHELADEVYGAHRP